MMDLAAEPNTPAPPAVLGLGEGLHSPAQRLAAVGLGSVLIVLTGLALRFGSVPGPEVTAFVPIVATFWALADVLTAFLLIAQFWVNGTKFLNVVGIAFLLSGLLTCPYLFAFPGVFSTGPASLGMQQISIVLWAVWHLSFPIIVALATFYGPTTNGRVVSPVDRRKIAIFTVLGTFAAAVSFTTLVYTQSASLPHLIIDGHFQRAYGTILAPAIAISNLAACVVLLTRRRRLGSLHLWILVALFTAALDGILNATAPSRFSYSWYVGKLETILTASVVLGMLLCEITVFYRRVTEVATLDTVTGLQNRRAFEDHVRMVFAYTRRRGASISLLAIDLDFFKGYSESHGHAAGDRCLRQIAEILRTAVTRPLDIAVRYDGDEFAVLLPETSQSGALAVAERVKNAISETDIPYLASQRGHITASIGVGSLASARDAEPAALLALAAHALQDAKARGRNLVVMEELAPVEHNVVSLGRDGESERFGT